MGNKTSSFDFAAVKTALAKPKGYKGLSRYEALALLHVMSDTEEHKVPLGSDGAGLLPLIKAAIAEEIGPTRLIAIGILFNLSTAPENQILMASPGLRLLPVLKVVVAGDYGEARDKVLGILYRMASNDETKILIPMVDPALGLLPCLKVALMTNTGVTKSLTVPLLFHLSTEPENLTPLSSLVILPALKKIVIEESGTMRALALCTLGHLSLATENKIVMASKEFGFLPVLCSVAKDNDQCKSAVVATLLVLSTQVENRKAIASPTLGVLPLLRKVVKENDANNRISALTALYNLSLIEETAVYMMISAELDLLPLLVEVVKADRADSGMWAMGILGNLSTTEQSETLMVSAEIGLLPLLGQYLVRRPEDSTIGQSAVLTLLRNLTCRSENRPILAAANLGLLPLLKSVVAEAQSEEILDGALNVIHNLAFAPENHLLMAADNLGLLTVLTKIMAVNSGKPRTWCLSTIVQLAGADRNKLLFMSPDLGLLPVLTNVVAKETSGVRGLVLQLICCLFFNSPVVLIDNEHLLVYLASDSVGLRFVLLKVLDDRNDCANHAKALALLGVMSYASDNKALLASSELGLITLLKKLIVGIEGELKSLALELLLSLSTVEENMVSFTSNSLGLLPLLKNIVAERTGDDKLNAICVLWNLSYHAPSRAPMASAGTGLLPVLKAVVESNTDCVIESLCVLLNLSLCAQNKSALTSASLGLVNVLMNILSGGVSVGERQRLATGILSNLSIDPATHALNVTSSKLWDEFGVDLELFVECVCYRLNVLDCQIAAEKRKGYVGLKAFKELNAQRAKVELEFESILSLDIDLPDEFLTLNEFPPAQALWLKSKVDEHSRTLMDNNASDETFSAFVRFHDSLPTELQSPTSHVHENIPFAEITERTVVLNCVDDQTVIVDGIFHDGPTLTNVKIKLRRRECIATIKHEFRTIEKFHRHSPNAVVAAFGLVSVTDRTLRCGQHTSVDGDLSGYVGIVLEKGTLSMAEYMTRPDSKDPFHQRALLVAAVKVVEAAHSHSLVLMDFKPQNIVYCISNGIGSWKAIDFDNSRYFGDEVERYATAHYASYELARHALNKRALKADPAMDICSLGWTAWKIFSGETLWESLGITDSRMILTMLANMTQANLLEHVENTFPGSGTVNQSLRNFLPQLLHVNPKSRLQASRLRTSSSLLGEKDSTVNYGAMMGAINRGFERTNSNVDRLAQEVRSAWANLANQLNESVFAKSLGESNAVGTVSVLSRIVELLEQQREDAYNSRLSVDSIARSMRSVHDDLANSLMPSITALVCNKHDQTMSELQKLDNVVGMVKDIKVQLDEVLNLQKTQLSILKHLQQLTYVNFPSTFIIIPQRPSGSSSPTGFCETVASAAKAVYDTLAKQLFSTMYLFFFCPVTGKLVRSGNGGNGYVLRLPKEWVKKLVPIVKMGLLVARLLLATQGLGGLIPIFPSSNDQQQLDNVLNSMIKTVDQAAVHLDNTSQLPPKLLGDRVVESLTDDMMTSIVEAVAKQDGATGSRSYRPRHMELEHVTSETTRDVAWVSKEGKNEFHSYGLAAFSKVK